MEWYAHCHAMANRAHNIQLTDRDYDILRLLDRTPVTTELLLKASQAFRRGGFRDDRRVRERMRALARAGLVKSWPMGLACGGSMNYYKLTPNAFRLLHGDETALPHGRFFSAVPMARLQHTQILAEVIVHTLAAAHRHRVTIARFYRENALTLRSTPHEVQPDCTFQFATSGETFNVLFEIDNSSESLDALTHQSIRKKILGYDAYQDLVWHTWKRAGRRGPRPYFRVAFLTKTIERTHNILTLAADLIRNKERRLCYAATQDSYVAEEDALRSPLFLDHRGHWQALVNIHPTSRFTKPPVRLRGPLAVVPPI